MTLNEKVQEAVRFTAPFRKGIRVAVFRPDDGDVTYFLEVVVYEKGDLRAVFSLQLDHRYFDAKYVGLLLRMGQRPAENKTMLRRAANGVVVTFQPVDPTQVPDEGLITEIARETPEPNIALTVAPISMGDKWFEALHIQTYSAKVLEQ